MSRKGVAEHMRTTYTAVFRPDDNGRWFIDVPEIPGCHSEARTIVRGRVHIREVIALVLDEDEDAFDVEVDVHLPDKRLQQLVARARKERNRARSAQESAAALTEEAARALVQTGELSLRDAAELLGVSHQRVQQLLTR